MSAEGPSHPSPATGRRRRWLVPLLVASLALNLVIVGAAVSGRYWSKHDGRGGFHRSAELMPRSFFAGLERERREELAAVFRARKPEFREERRALRAAAAALADALEREPYDAGQAQSAITDHAGRSRELIDLGAAIAEQLLEALTPEERRALAGAIRQRLEEDRQRRERYAR